MVKWKFSLMGFVYRVVWVLKALSIFLSETNNFLRKLHKKNIFGMPRKFYHRVMYIAPSSGHISLAFNMPFKLILRRFEVVSDVWGENDARFERLREIHSNPPILHYGFNINIAWAWMSSVERGLDKADLPEDIKAAVGSYSVWHVKCVEGSTIPSKGRIARFAMPDGN